MAKGLPYSLKRAGILPPADRGVPADAGPATPGPAAGSIKQVIPLTDFVIPLADNAGVVAYGGVKVFDFPAGLIKFEGAVMDLVVTKSSAGVNDDWNGDVGLGTVVANNSNALATTEQNLVPTTATPEAVDGVTTADGLSTATESGALFDGTTTPVDAYLNFLVDDADHDVTTTPCNLIVNGKITLVYTNLGDK